jgi:small subunit ribosomal protein S20
VGVRVTLARSTAIRLPRGGGWERLRARVDLPGRPRGFYAPPPPEEVSPFGRIPAPEKASFSAMPNIKQQERRVRRSARERLENLRWRSTAKTLERRVADSVAAGDSARAAEEQRALVQWLDKASARGAIHPNRAARKKAQAARRIAGKDR